MGLRLTVNIAGEETRFTLDEGNHPIGSGSDARIRIVQSTVSRIHAEINCTGSKIFIRDLGSRNGTALNGRLLADWQPIKAGDKLRFGQVNATLSQLNDAETVVAIPGDPRPSARDQASDTEPAPAATLATNVLSSFAAQHLPQLLDRLTTPAGEIEDHAIQLANALHRSAGVSVEIHRGQGLVAKAGEAGSDVSNRRERGEWSITLSDFDPEQELAFGELSRLGLSLLTLASRIEAAPVAELESSPEPGPAPTAGTKPKPGTPISPPDPATAHQGLREVYRQAMSVAKGNICVLIEGESGTGKELLARFLHEASADPDKPLVVLNCASLSRDLLEAELFGIEKGVATGVDARPGKFELADGGTLFLDEIGDMALETQAKILRVLQEREVTRVGGQLSRPARVRVVSATNLPIDEMVSGGDFRRDLYHRIADWTVEIPPLRERRMDVPNLAAHFLRRACQQADKTFGGLSEGAVHTLLRYSWPGNVRELEREMQRCALFLSDGEMLDSEMLQERIRNPNVENGGSGLEGELARSEREAIKRALDSSGGNVANAAEQLGIGRSTLYRRIKELGLGSG